MSDYNGFQRTNFVKVKDVSGFKMYADRLEAEVIEITPPDGNKPLDTRYALIPKSHNLFSDKDVDTDESIPIEGLIQFLEDGEVLILQESGRQARNYCTGNAVAMRCKDGNPNNVEYLQVNIDDIYSLVKEKWNTEATMASS